MHSKVWLPTWVSVLLSQWGSDCSLSTQWARLSAPWAMKSTQWPQPRGRWWQE